MRLRPVRLLVALPALAALAACSSTTAGKGSDDTSAPTSSSPSSPSSTASSSAGPAANAKSLAELLQHGVANVQSAHFELATKAAGQAVTGSGDEKLSSGKVQALHLTETVGAAGTFEIILVDGKGYAKLPSSLNTSGKPYILLSPDSSNATARQLATTINTTLTSSASLQSIGALATAATSIKVVGREKTNGVDTTHYALVVDPTKITSDPTTKSTLTQAGVTSIPMQLYVDDQGRPVLVDQTITVSGQTVTTKVTLSRYNQPVDISAPPASQVSAR